MDHDPGGNERSSWFDALLAEVDRAFDATGADTPGWPDPHPDRSRLEEEYSRVTDVGKYRILESRIDAWVAALTDAGLARVCDVPASPWIAGCRPPDQHQRVRRIEPVRRNGLALLVATALVDGSPFGLDLGTCRSDEQPVFLTTIPHCGCDACDSGSEDLLEDLDSWVLTVAQGGVVHARRGEDVATRTRYGWSTANRGQESWLDGSASVLDGVVRWVGTSWV